MSVADRRRLVPRLRLRGSRRERPRRAPRVPRPGVRTVAVLVVVIAVLAGAFLWLRQSALVAVRHVRIAGVSGPDAAQIRTALTGAARGMSTLALDPGRLHAAVAPYPVVRSLRLHSHFPHGLTITVSEQIPVAILVADGSRIMIAADGTLLRNVRTVADLPTVTVPVVPGGTHVTGMAAAAVGLLAAAPDRLLSRVTSARQASGPGLVATLRNGPQIVFGSGSDLAAKWRAAVAVLASQTSAGASYIDVTDPARPAAGSATDGLPETGGDASAPGDGIASTTGTSTAQSPATATAPTATSPASPATTPSDSSTTSTSSTG